MCLEMMLFKSKRSELNEDNLSLIKTFFQSLTLYTLISQHLFDSCSDFNESANLSFHLPSSTLVTSVRPLPDRNNNNNHAPDH